MKKLFLALSLMFVTVTMMAVPAKRGMWQTITLADGTEVRVEKVGDEHGHWLRAADGTCYVKNGETYEQADIETLQTKRQVRIDTKKMKRKAVYASTNDGLGEKGTMSRGAVPSIGEYTIPLVMVQFSDLKFKSTTTVEKMKRYYNEEGYNDESGCKGSVRDYFKAQSGGQFIPTFDVVGIVTLSKSYKYYGSNDREGNDQNLDDLPGDVIAAAVSQLGVDFSKYVVSAGDSYHKKGVPLLSMMYAGKGEATEYDNADDYLWPCEWDDDEDVKGGTYQGIHFNSFFVGNELIGSKLMGMSVFCHEFGHALGLPDFYCTDYSYEKDDAFGNWSIMDTGSYLDDECRAPVGYTAYEKSYMGWLELQEIGSVESVTLQLPEGTADNSAYIIRNSSTETFIFENRQPDTWNPSSMGLGVLVTRIAYSKSLWTSNTLNNTQSRKRACVLTADGAKLYYSASSANLYGNKKTSIETLKTLNGSTKAINIKNISKNNDGTITLTLTGDAPDPTPGPDPTPTPSPDGALFYESFDGCNGTGGNDGEWSGTIANASFVPDNDGWEAEKSYGANKCAKFGNSSIAGSATTPAFTLNGTATLTFKAGAWNTKNDGTILTVTVNHGSIEPSESFTITKGAFQDYKATVTADGVVTITFASTKGRFFLDEVLVKQDTATGLSSVAAPTQTDSRIYTIDGRFVGSNLGQLPRGIYIIGGRKVVK